MKDKSNLDKLCGIETFGPTDKPYGFSFEQWTVKWWRWAVSIPMNINPVVDLTGEYAGANQKGPVWFLAGTFGENIFPIRKCEVPSEKAILFPVINYEINTLENPRLRTNDALIEHVVGDINDIVKKEAYVDGVSVPVYRCQSSPPVFKLKLGKHNCLEIKDCTVNAASDGYWVFLKPLPHGKHEIFFHGSCSGGTRNSKARYFLTIRR